MENIKEKGFMLIDDNFPIDFDKLTPGLKEYCLGMEKAFENNDEATWDYYHEAIGSYAKNEHACGYITSKQMHDIWERYFTAG